MFENVRKVLAAQFEIDPSSVTPDTSLIDDLGADSLDIVDLIVSLEDEYGISIPDEVAPELTTVGKIAAYLESVID